MNPPGNCGLLVFPAQWKSSNPGQSLFGNNRAAIAVARGHLIGKKPLGIFESWIPCRVKAFRKDKKLAMKTNSKSALPVTIIIDETKCSGCGLCVLVCPMRTISLYNGKARVSGVRSLNCGHCAAVCPEAAISVPAIDESMLELSTIDFGKRWLGYGDFDASQLVSLIASRRSCRNFLHRPVERSILEDLVKIGAMGPSATNRQSWTFTIIPAKNMIRPLVDPICVFYERLNQLVSRAWFRFAMKIIRRNEFDFYYRAYLPYLEEKIQLWRQRGQDEFFYEAPSAILVGSKSDGILGKEDALLATQNILLAAHAMGLGTCLLGLVAGAMQRKPEISRQTGVPMGESLCAVIAVGYSDQIYRRPAGRKKAEIRFTEQ